ncbi:MAG TPA: thiolase family protein [Anaerolineae bacterium]|nr:thiolase family protein [Anaerolineae bacterium]
MHEVLVIDAVRTPIGRIRGALAAVRPDDLGAAAIRALMERQPVDPLLIGDVFFGCANQAGEDNRNVGRMAALLAGLPHQVPATTINRLCGSSLDALQQAARMLAVGDGRLAIAGGVESMTRAPLSLPKSNPGWASGNATAWDTTLGWRYPNPRLEALFPLEAMGETAENIREATQISRERQDAFALRSHQRAVAAWEAGRFADEVAAVEVPAGKGRTEQVARDDGPRADSSLAALAALRPIFRPGGTVTAGNASSLNDGAAAVLLAQRDVAVELGLRPLARVLASAVVGVDPRLMGLGPVPASRLALERAGLTVKDLDLVELNEAFAVQALACIDQLGLDEAIVNVNGGAIALGHPLGASGARLVTTLLHEMRRRGPNCRYGLATMCIGVGQGVATVFENLAD